MNFSNRCLIAIRQAAALARRFRSEVTLLHVNEFLVVHPLSGPLGFGIPSWEATRSAHLAARHAELDQFGAAELSGVKVRRIVCSGDPAKVIVERARDERSDLILIPTHGGGVFRRFLLGSVTAKVLHDAESPVWTGAHLANGVATVSDVGRVMCAVDFGPHAVKALEWANGFASAMGAKLTVVHAVLETPPNLPERYAFQWHGEAHTGADERLRALMLDAGVEADSLVVSNGDIPKALLSAAQRLNADLMVIGRTSAGETEKRLGSHCYSVICCAPCPVVSV